MNPSPGELLDLACQAAWGPGTMPPDVLISPKKQAGLSAILREAAMTLSSGDGDVAEAIITAQKAACLADLMGDHLTSSLLAAIASIEDLADLVPLDDALADHLTGWLARHPLAERYKLAVIAAPESIDMAFLSGTCSDAVGTGKPVPDPIIDHDFTRPTPTTSRPSHPMTTAKNIIHLNFAEACGANYTAPGNLAAAFSGKLSEADQAKLLIKPTSIPVQLKGGKTVKITFCRSLTAFDAAKKSQRLSLLIECSETVERVSIVDRLSGDATFREAMRNSKVTYAQFVSSFITCYTGSRAFPLKSMGKGVWQMDVIQDYAHVPEADGAYLLFKGHYCVELAEDVIVLDDFKYLH